MPAFSKFAVPKISPNFLTSPVFLISEFFPIKPTYRTLAKHNRTFQCPKSHALDEHEITHTPPN